MTFASMLLRSLRSGFCPNRCLTFSVFAMKRKRASSLQEALQTSATLMDFTDELWAVLMPPEPTSAEHKSPESSSSSSLESSVPPQADASEVFNFSDLGMDVEDHSTFMSQTQVFSVILYRLSRWSLVLAYAAGLFCSICCDSQWQPIQTNPYRGI